MDYIVLSALVSAMSLLVIVITYDIACQWQRNLQERMSKYYSWLQIPLRVHVECAVPSWHVKGHSEKCQTDWISCAVARY